MIGMCLNEMMSWSIEYYYTPGNKSGFAKETGDIEKEKSYA